VSSGLDRDRASGTTATSSYLSYINPAYNADVSVSITQPLLQNAGTAVNRAAIERARIGVNRAGLDFKGSVLLVVRNVETAYYNLCFAREQLNVYKSSLQLAQTLFDEAKSRKQAGVVTDLDVLQAEVGVSDARRNVILAEQSVHNEEDALLNLIGQFEFNTPVGDIRFPDYTERAPSFDVSYNLARDNQPDLLSAQASVKQVAIDAATSKNGRLPQLDLGGAVGYNTTETSSHRAISELPDSNGYNWELSLSFRMPWGLKAERARYRSALSTLNQTRARVQQLEQNLVVQVRGAVRSVETNIESVAISSQGTQLSVKKYELEKARFDAGLSTARFVLQAQDELATSRVNELQSKVNLRNAIADLHRLEGSSLERFNIILP
ncbi:MAG: TolC family protein, partial [Opitutaceae bacterium]